MGKRKSATPRFGRIVELWQGENHTLFLHRDKEWDEYTAVVRTKDDAGTIVATYHTDDESDARATGLIELRRCDENNIVEELEPDLV
jgi:IMP cyclohydrolase